MRDTVSGALGVPRFRALARAAARTLAEQKLLISDDHCITSGATGYLSLAKVGFSNRVSESRTGKSGGSRSRVGWRVSRILNGGRQRPRPPPHLSY